MSGTATLNESIRPGKPRHIEHRPHKPVVMRLPLTSIERYHLCNDTSRNPNVICCELSVRGELDLDIATEAAREAVKRHPMLSARLEKRRWRRPVWNLDPANAKQLVWELVDEHSGDLRRIDPEKGLPARFLVRRMDDGSTRLSLRVHHAAIDGGGGLQVLNDWLMTYHRISCGTEKPGSRATNLELLGRRNHLRLFNREFIGRLWMQLFAVIGACEFLFRRVQPVSKPGASPATANDVNDFQIVSHCFDADQLSEIKSEAAQSMATTNELMLRAAFLALHDFRKRRGIYQTGEWLRLIVPINIRDYADRRLPAANRATLVQLDRSDVHFADPARLIWGLNYELGFVKRWNLEKTFLLALRWLSCIPGYVSRSTRRDVCRATSVVTNLGAPLERNRLKRTVCGKLRSGNLVVESVTLIVPLRPQTAVGFAVARYNGKQKIDLHFDPSQIEREQAEEILRLFVVQLESLPYAMAVRNGKSKARYSS